MKPDSGFLALNPKPTQNALNPNSATLRTLLDTGSQLARDRFVTGSLTGRRSQIYYEPIVLANFLRNRFVF